MSGQLKRYQLPEVVNHLASQYVLGTLTPVVRNRTEKLRREYAEIDERILYWETTLFPLDAATEEVAPQAQTWESLQQQLFPEQAAPRSVSIVEWFQTHFYQLTSGLSLAVVALISMLWWQQPSEQTEALSYLAVMQNAQQEPQMVATTYGESRTLALELLHSPNLNDDEGLELWVTSKTDKQVRSLGVLPKGQQVISRELTEAEWRLIKDSEYLLLTREESGGSPIGEPMGELISKGLCIRMAGWQEDA